MRLLGKHQRLFLQTLVEHRVYYAGGPWTWGSPSKARKLLDGLQKRGLVEAKHEPWTPYAVLGDRLATHLVWRATARGHALAGVWKAERDAARFARHQARDPHCTCNDCIAAHAARLEE